MHRLRLSPDLRSGEEAVLSGGAAVHVVGEATASKPPGTGSGAGAGTDTVRRFKVLDPEGNEAGFFFKCLFWVGHQNNQTKWHTPEYLMATFACD